MFYLSVFTFLLASAWSYNPNEVVVTGHELPTELVDVGVSEHLGDRLDLNLIFTNDKGETGTLRQLLPSTRPMLLAMVYYKCPSLCNLHLNKLTEKLKDLAWTSGREFDLVAISMDHTETAPLAAAKKESYLKLYGRGSITDNKSPGDNSENAPDLSGWHFLVGSKENVKAVADQLGFRFKWLPEKNQFAHAAVTHVITPDGRISRYLHGIEPDLTTLKLSILEASSGKIGTMIEQAMMFCLQFDPRKNKYTLYAWNLMRLGAIVIVLLIIILIVPIWWREQMMNRNRT